MSKKPGARVPEEIPLSAAIWRFASSNLKAQARGAERREISKFGPYASPEEAKANFVPVMKSLLEEFNKRAAPQLEMQQRLLTKLRSGVLQSFGIQTKPTVRQSIERILPHFFDDKPKILWNRNIVENFGLRYERVRIRIDQNSAKVPYKKTLGVVKNSIGRPSKDEEITRALNALVAKGHPIGRINRAAAIGFIRDEARVLGSDISVGFSDPVIQRVLLRAFGKRTGSNPKS